MHRYTRLDGEAITRMENRPESGGMKGLVTHLDSWVISALTAWQVKHGNPAIQGHWSRHSSE